MQPLAQRTQRIVGAIEDFAAQEKTAVQQRNFIALPVIQDRLAALVADLAGHAGQLRDPALQKRVRAVYEQRTQTNQLLESELVQVRGQILQTENARRTTAKIAPAYGAKAGFGAPSLSFVG